MLPQATDSSHRATKGRPLLRAALAPIQDGHHPTDAKTNAYKPTQRLAWSSKWQ